MKEQSLQQPSCVVRRARTWRDPFTHTDTARPPVSLRVRGERTPRCGMRGAVPRTLGSPHYFPWASVHRRFPPRVTRHCRIEEISRSCSSIGGGGALAPAPRHLLPRRHDRHHSVLNRPCRNALLYLAREHPRSLPWQANVPSAFSRGHLKSMLSVRCRALSHIAC